MISSTQEIRRAVEINGYAIVSPCLSIDTCDVLATELTRPGAGTRNLLQIGAVRALASSPQVRELATAVLGDSCFAVKATLFNKNPIGNWKVPWHQDRMIAVKSRREVDGFALWSVKEDILHVQPPAEVMSKVLAVRLHLDDCPEEAGPLKILPGSFNRYLSDDEVRSLACEIEPAICTVSKGGGILMRPLALHSSSKCDSPVNRRVIHIEFANQALPAGLDWHERVA